VPFFPQPTRTPTPATAPASSLPPPTPIPTLSPTASLTPAPSLTPTPSHTPTPSATPYPPSVTDFRAIEMVLVPAGEFMMGFDGSGSPDDERPVHPVFLDAYYVDKYEISNAQYAECVSWRICAPPVSYESYNLDERYYGNSKYEAYPVTFVTWEMANNYCTQWRKGRLPTEAEWEKAARGPDSRIFPWGEGIKCDLANYRDQNCGRLARPYPVSAFAAGQSVYGAFNMAGNVWEWTLDWYSFSYYSESPVENPQGPLTGIMHVKRGGGFLHIFPFARSSNREQGEPTGYGVDIGFRCVRPVSPAFP
ncbi:MAG: SUMF1/EgtB/PvdO family nonheme iron enzyme, partial [Chloroflexota bacterium]